MRIAANPLYPLHMKPFFLFIVIVASFLFSPDSWSLENHSTSLKYLGNVSVSSFESYGVSLSERRSFNHFFQRISHFSLEYQGIPLFFEKLVLQTDVDGRVVREFHPSSFSVDKFNNHPRPSLSQVSDWALSRGYSVRDGGDFGWIVDSSGYLLPVVRVETLNRHPQNAMVIYLDACSGKIAESDPLFKTSVSHLDAISSFQNSLGQVFLENPVTTPIVSTVPLDHLDSDTVHLYGAYARVETCTDIESCDASEPIAVRSDRLDVAFDYEPLFFSDPQSPDPFAEVNVYRNITDISSWVRSTFGWDGLFNGETWVKVKVGQSWDNAAYYSGSKSNPPYIVFGIGEVNYAYDADTAYHEYGHAINDLFWQHVWMAKDEYGLDLSMFAVEEAIADLWSSTFSQDPVLNAYVTTSRNVDNKSSCPFSLYSEGHYDSRFVSGFLWDVRKVIGGDPFNHILYRSLSFLDKDVTFVDFVEALETSASDLASEETAGVEAWHVDVFQEKARARGLLDEACLKRLVPFEDKQTRYVVGYGRDRTNKTNFPFGLQWVISSDGDNRSIHLDLDWIYPDADDDGQEITPGYRVHVRKNRPVEVVWRDPDNLDEGDDAFDVVADFTWEGSPRAVEYPLIGGEPLEKGEQVYVLVSAESDESVIVIQADLRMISESIAAPPSDASSSFDFDGETDINAVDGTGNCSVAPSFHSTQESIFSFIARMIFPGFQP